MSEGSTQPPTPPAVQATKILCPNCDYNLTGVAIGSSCPECGLVIGRGTFSAVNLPMSGKAIASLVLGILSIVSCSAYGILSVPCEIIAMVLASKVKGQIVRKEVSPNSAGMAKAGSICGLIGLILGGALLAFFVVIIVFGVALGF